jgi:hypothetical protein
MWLYSQWCAGFVSAGFTLAQANEIEATINVALQPV